MKKLFHVYIIRNQINKKVYIGKTSGNPQNRWNKHIKIAEGKGSYARYTKYHIHLAIAKYGSSKFSFSILNSFESENDAYAAEISNIQKYDSIKNGYNIALGGKSGGSGCESNVALFTKDQILDIFQSFVNGLSGADIARKFNCTKTTIYDILDRITYCSVNIEEHLVENANKVRMLQKKTPTNQLNISQITNDYLAGLSYREIAKNHNSSTFSIQKILKSQIDQSIIDKNKMQSIDAKLGANVIADYLSSDMTANEIGQKYKISKYVVYDILRGKTFAVETNILVQIKEVKKRKSAKKA